MDFSANYMHLIIDLPIPSLVFGLLFIYRTTTIMIARAESAPTITRAVTIMGVELMEFPPPLDSCSSRI